ncbi:MAG: cupin domain-containing protein [Labilithrix sp.]|nr:cupin domain-containing protein [Labilithrix sp.]MCW5835439.1 cupin domain-containing protein [Labilithrix sp.]
MSDSNLGLEDLLQRRLPSAFARDDASLVQAGVAAADLAGTKDAVAAIGLTTSAAAPPPALRERLLASRGRPGRYGVFADRVARLFDLPLPDAEALMKRIERPSEWTPFLVEGLEMIPVVAGPACAGAIATLVRIQPGATFPDHAHRGDETMLVLDGGFREPADGGEEVWRGDEIFRGDGSEHALVALPGVPCVAAVLIFGHGDFR